MLLLIPFDRPLTRATVPYATVLIIVANLLVYGALQTMDDQKLELALAYYQGQQLTELEWPLYRDYLDAQQRGDEIRHLRESLTNGPAELIFTMDRDAKFKQRINTGYLLNRLHPDYRKWRSARREFQRRLDKVSWYRFGLRPGDITLPALGLHTFLHGDLGHLLGNMLFLALIGFLVEGAIGRSAFLLSYVLLGLSSAGFDILLSGNSLVPSVGASGAVSGMMGLYAALFGFRRVKFFVLIVAYIGYWYAPALLLGVVWLAWELIQQFTAVNANVNYLAHIGGLISGALLGAFLRMDKRNLDQEFLDHSDNQRRLAKLQREFESHVRDLDFRAAVPVLQKSLEIESHDLEQWHRLYLCARTMPHKAEFHDSARKILGWPVLDSPSNAIALEVYGDYLERARPKPQLNVGLMELTLQRAIKEHHLEVAEMVLRAMLRKIKHFPELAQLGDTFLRLLRNAGQKRKAEYYRRQLAQHFSAFRA